MVVSSIARRATGLDPGDVGRAAIPHRALANLQRDRADTRIGPTPDRSFRDSAERGYLPERQRLGCYPGLISLVHCGRLSLSQVLLGTRPGPAPGVCLS